jgi:hypothetical protein
MNITAVEIYILSAVSFLDSATVGRRHLAGGAPDSSARVPCRERYKEGTPCRMYVVVTTLQ